MPPEPPVPPELPVPPEPTVNLASSENSENPEGAPPGSPTGSRSGAPSGLAAGPVHLEVVVPAYNEAARLPEGLALLGDKLAALAGRGVRAEIIVVDNASTDGTSDVVCGWRGPVPVRLLHCARRGKGAAVRVGLLATRAPYAGFCDADMATGLDALDDALALLGAGHRVVVGSRRHPDSLVEGYGQPMRRLGAITFNRLVRDLTGGIPDTQCGFKFFTGRLARAAAADLMTTGFAFDVELLMHCVRWGVPVTAIPVVWRDRPGTTFSVRRHTYQCLLDLARIRARAGLPGPFGLLGGSLSPPFRPLSLAVTPAPAVPRAQPSSLLLSEGSRAGSG